MSVSALARDLPKSRISCCWGTQAPCRSHGVLARAPVSIAASCTGPHVLFSPVARLCAYTAPDLATHSFQIHRQRAHSASSPVRAVDDTRRR
ncbi:hypothetical protein [Streptomyces sp. NPDC059900]|uniref:hypothetical protein n=1 Tax=Streptomyces sp. NPDC059900 TaxID=3155816 RepID=UPI003D045A76